jgi:hypothetical protein
MYKTAEIGDSWYKIMFIVEDPTLTEMQNSHKSTVPLV